MQAPLVRWEREFAGKPVTIVYVAEGLKVTPERVMEVMKAEGAGFPVAYDATSATTNAYQVRAFPTAYVIGPDGTVVWEGIPHYDPRVPEAAIRAALAGAGRASPPP